MLPLLLCLKMWLTRAPLSEKIFSERTNIMPLAFFRFFFYFSA
ncbi:pheST operon leader peptide PheM [Photorhabdus stackebrandtii]